MIPGTEAPTLAAGIEALERVRDRLAGAPSIPAAWSAELRAALESLNTVAAGAGVESIGEAVRRLLLMTEVGDCLDADGPGAADALPDFFREALDRLAVGLRMSDPDPAADWILRQSKARWGEYLALLDPEPAPEPWGPDPEAPVEVEAAPAIALTALLRLMDDGVGSSRGLAEAPPATTGCAPPAPAVVDVAHRPGEPSDDPPELDLERAVRALSLDEEIRQAFVADLSDLLEKIQELVLGLGGANDAARLGELRRCYHTLKGTAGSVGLVGLASEIHALEGRLERAGGRVSAELSRRLERSLDRLEGLRAVLGGSAPMDAGETGQARDQQPADHPHGPPTDEPDGLMRVPTDRFEHLTDLCSELLTRRLTWAEQAERMRQLADTTRTCSQRLRTSVERLREVAASGAHGRAAERAGQGEDLPGLVRRMAEQAEDLTALAAATRELALPAWEESEALTRLVLRLWETLQAVRVVPVRGLFRRLVRVAHDAARVEGRAIEVELIGDQTGADRVLLDKAYEPLLHAVRNAVGHGIEPPEVRAGAGKPETGRITLEARREGNTLAITVQDDGRGLDHEAIAAKARRLGLLGPGERPGTERLHELIFQPGFSTREHANANAGRGVGMDVIAREVESLRGRIELATSAGSGTRLTIRLPARLSLERVLVVRVGGQAFALPISAVDSVRRDEEGVAVGAVGGGHPVVGIGDRRIPVADLSALLGSADRAEAPCPTLLVVGNGEESLAVRVDRVEGALELVTRPLGPLLTGHPILSGAGLTTGGEVVLGLDVAGLLRRARAGPAGPIPCEVGGRPRALVVDDSLSVRRTASRHLQALGLDVDEAADGEKALGKLRDRPYRLVLTDVEMPRMDGLALLLELRRTGVLETTAVVVASTLSDPETRRRALDLGARAYLTKPLVAEELAGVVDAILGRDSAPLAASGSAPRR
jgi:chemosensory pili system protein ChpA (sensor histidine kinase/response regulator)